MKRNLVTLLLVCILGFFNTAFAQTMPNLKASSVSNTSASIKQMQTLFETADVQKKVKTEMLKNERLQSEAIKILKNNPDTASQVLGLLKKNPTSKSKVMDAILKNPELTKTVMNYIKNNPELLQKVMSLVGIK